ncbi:DNA topoisomerase IV [Algoriphagus sediminis]|uniref:DNA topoisomerase IV n=1 Tax=Algoriphagus sediminis TaxID=3057113 RepID=A0ABT7YAZ9_9BACT|nr:DNA topoisomerase IV [Algoriphagus sediminis]MDN3203686.1 DNA topoisomerase IV [Algoriphagus sediminis]
MYSRFGKVFYFFMVFGFIFFLLYFYSAMPETVQYQPDSPTEHGRDAFFYSIIALFVVCNLVVLLPPKLLETKTHNGLHKLFPVGDDYRDYFLAWFYTFGAILNTCLLVMVFFVHAINNQEGINASEFNFFFYLIPLLLVIWVIAFFILLVNKFKQVRLDS